MKHSSPKRLLAVVLSLLMMFTVVQSFPQGIFSGSTITADAADNQYAGVMAKIGEIKALFPTGTPFTANGKKNNSNANDNCHLDNIMAKNAKVKALGTKFNESQYCNGWSCLHLRAMFTAIPSERILGIIRLPLQLQICRTSP